MGVKLPSDPIMTRPGFPAGAVLGVLLLCLPALACKHSVTVPPPTTAPRERPPVNAPPAAPGAMPATVGTAAFTIAETPVYIRPDATLTPLRTLPRSTPVRVLEEVGEWMRIEFQDAQWGRRVGYAQRQNMQLTK